MGNMLHFMHVCSYHSSPQKQQQQQKQQTNNNQKTIRTVW